MLVPPAESDLRAFVSAALRDPSLSIAFWDAEERNWVDADGRRVAVDPAKPGVAVVADDGDPVAALVCDPTAAADGERLELALRASALWLENRRLQLTLHSRLAEQEALRRV